MTERKVIEVPINQLVCRRQVRQAFDESELTGLARSISENGVLQPLLVRRDGEALIVVDGERRLRAARDAGLKEVPIIIDERPLSDSEVTQRQLVLDAQRSGLGPLERARAIDTLMRDTAWTGAQVAVKLGISPATVSRLLTLLVLPADVQSKVESGKIPASSAVELARFRDPQERGKLAEEVLGSGLSRDALTGRRRNAGRQSASGRAARRVTATLGPDRVVTIAGPGLSLDTLIAWLEELLVKARKVRPKGIELDTFLRLLRDEAKRPATGRDEAKEARP